LPGAHPSRGFGVGLPVTRPVWDSNLGPHASEIGSLTTELSVQLGMRSFNYYVYCYLLYVLVFVQMDAPYKDRWMTEGFGSALDVPKPKRSGLVKKTGPYSKRKTVLR
jgi:hypothetical protein